jgi:hypothetical protein
MWTVADKDGQVPTWERVGIAVLMDIRDELQTLNRLLACPNFLGIPHTLTRIARNTTKKKAKRRRKVAR